MGAGAGMFCLESVQKSSPGRGLSGLNADPVSQQRECPGPRHHHVGESARAREDRGVGRELGT